MNRIGLWDISLNFIDHGLIWLGISILITLVYFIFIKFWLKPSLAKKTSKKIPVLAGIIVSIVFFISFYKSLKPIVSYVYYFYGNLCISEGKYVNALWEFKEAAKLYPTNDKFNERVGLLSYVKNDYSTALKYFDAVEDMTPESMIYYGAAQIQLGFYETEEKNIRSALEYQYNPNLAYYFLGMSLHKQKKYDKAEKALLNSISTIVKPMKCVVEWELASVYIDTNRPALAKKYAEKIVSSKDIPSDILSMAKSFLKAEKKNEEKIKNKP